ncbi:MAG TPA: sugar transferase [Aggregatilineales bacterium]|nr:sugar transferase [Aggregatilineales bacterium]
MRNWTHIFRRAMPLLDFVLVLISFRLAYILRYELQIGRPVLDELFISRFEDFLPWAVLFATWLVVTPPVAALYRDVRGRSWFEEVYGITNGATSAAVVILAVSYLLDTPSFSRLMIIEATLIVVILLSLERLVYRMLRRFWRVRGIGVDRVLIIGAGDVGRAVLSAMLARPHLGYTPVGYLDDNPDRGEVDMGRLRGLGDTDHLATLLGEKAADLVIITLPWAARQRIMELVEVCRSHSVTSRIVPDLFQLNLSQVGVENLDGIPLLGIRSDTRMNRTKVLMKRAIDLIIVILASPVLAILATLVALAIKLDSRGPILYRHRRVGENGKQFWMYKFRSMYEDADKRHADLIRRTNADPRRPKWENDPRITRVGKWLRRSSIDEWPNMINVMRGEMSIVGPRPPTPDEVTLYEPWQRQRLNTRPGMTGLWQVSGRSKIPFEEQCLLDIYYIENWSINLDIQILLRTMPSVILGNGAY